MSRLPVLKPPSATPEARHSCSPKNRQPLRMLPGVRLTIKKPSASGEVPGKTCVRPESDAIWKGALVLVPSPATLTARTRK